MTRPRAVATVVVLCLLVACKSNSATPAHPGPVATPKSVDEITGIWRTTHQNTLELRKNDTFVLITPVGKEALAGDYALSQDKITFFNTKACGAAQGNYRIQASPKSRIELTQADDACGQRKLALSDPFIYAQPDFS